MSNDQERDGSANREPRKGAWSAEEAGSGAVRAKIEQAGGVHLDAGRCQRLRWETKQYVEGYRRWKDKHSEAPKRLDLLIATLGETIRALEERVMLDLWHSGRRGSVKEVRP